MVVSPFAVAVFFVGLLLYVIPSNAKVQRIGEILMFAGALGVVMMTGAKTVRFG